MSPTAAWTAFLIGGAIYHGAKHLLGFPPAWADYLSAGYWVGLALLAVELGWVRNP